MKRIIQLFLIFVVLFMFVLPVSASTIYNRNFIYSYDGWTANTGGTGSVVAYVNWAEIDSDTHGGQINLHTESAYTGPIFANLCQSINVTGVNEVSYQGMSGYLFSNSGGSGGGDSFKMTIGGLTQESPINGTWNTYTLDVSSLSGVHQLKFELYTYNTGAGLLYGNYHIKNVDTDVGESSPDYNDVFWNKDPYYTGDTANITTKIYDFDNSSYSYYLDIYNTDDYVTTYQIMNEAELNYYTFPIEWGDTSLLAKLQRVTEPHGTNEVNLAMAMSHFETLTFDSTIAFDQSSYNPGDTLKVTWSGAPAGSSVWLQSGSDGGHIKHNVSYSGSFYFTVPDSTQETSYRVDIAYDGSSQAMDICTINADIVPDYSTAVMSIGYFYANRSGWVPPIKAVVVSQNDVVKHTIYTNMHPDYYNVYYSPDHDSFDTFFTDYTIIEQYVSDTSWTYIDGVQVYQTITNITLPNSDNGVFRIKFEAVNITTHTSDDVETHFNVGSLDHAIDIYDYYMRNGYHTEIEYYGTSVTVPYNDLILFGVLTDEIINISSFKINDLEIVGVANVTSDYFIVRGYSLMDIGKNTVEIEVENIPTGSTDVMTWDVFVSGTTVPDGVTAQLYFMEDRIALGDFATVFYNIVNITNPSVQILYMNDDTKYKCSIQEDQSGSFEYTPLKTGQYTACIIDADNTVYAQIYLWVTEEGFEWEQDPDTGEWEETPEVDIDDIGDSFGTKFETMLSNDAFIALLVIIACVGAFGKIGGVVGVFLGMVTGISISFLMGYLPTWILFIMVLALCVVFVSKLVNSFGGGE